MGEDSSGSHAEGVRRNPPVVPVAPTIASAEVETRAPELMVSGLVGEQFRSGPNAVFGAAVVRQAQQSYGNQAVQRALAAGPTVQRDPPVAAPPVTDAEAETKMTAALHNSALGQSALAIKAKYLVTLVWTDSGAAGFEENGNRCRINRNLDPTEAAGYFTHEMHHAEERISGRSQDADKYADDQEDAYVTKMVNEEIAGTFLQFEAMVQMGGGTRLSPTGANLFPQYRRVRQQAIDSWLKASPGDQSGAEADARTKCQMLVNYWVTSSTGTYNRVASKGTNKPMPTVAPSAMDSYENYYVRLFRRAHAQQRTP
jgi:hypothetical protein